jgi:hypothetical protein
VLTRTDARPRGEPARVAEAGHVDADLGDERLGAAPVDARDRVQEGDLCAEGLNQPIDLGRQAPDCLVEVVEHS